MKDGGGDVFWLQGFFERVGGELLRTLFDEFCVGKPRHDAAGADAGGSFFKVDRVGEAEQTAFRGLIGCAGEVGDDASGGRDVEDVAGAGLAHVRQERV